MEDAVAGLTEMANEGKPAAPQADSDTLTKLVGYYEEWDEATRESRQRSERTRDYYDGKQLTEEEASTLKARGDPHSLIRRLPGPDLL